MPAATPSPLGSPWRDRRRVGAAAAALALLAAVAGTWWLSPEPELPLPSQALQAPRVYYEIVAGRGVTLYERRLDGRSLPRLVAVQPGASYARTFVVSPNGSWALALLATVDDTGKPTTAITRIHVADGASLALGIVDGTVSVPDGIWSPDETTWAAPTWMEDGDQGGTLVVDVPGATTAIFAPTTGLPLAFEGRGRLLLYAERQQLDGRVQSWTFERVEVENGDAYRVAVGALGPVPAPNARVSLVTGLGVVSDARETGLAISIRDLRTNDERMLAEVPDTSWVAFTADGRSIVACGTDRFSVIGLDGTVREVGRGQNVGCVDRGFLSPTGGVAGFAQWAEGSELRLVDVATGGLIQVPLPGRSVIAEAHLVAFVGAGLAGASLPSVADPTPSPPPRGGAPVAGAPAFFRVLQSPTRDGATELRVERVTAGASGGMTTLAAMPPIVIDRASDEVSVRALTAIDGSGVVLVISWSDGQAIWRWDGTGVPQELAVPDGWPVQSDGLALRPDGGALAATRFRDGIGSELVTWQLGNDRLEVAPMPEDYVRVDGWPLPDRVLAGYAICTEGCDGRYAVGVLVDPATGAVDPVSDDGTSGGHALHYVWVDTPRTIRLNAINEEPSDDRAVAWPDTLPPLEQVRRYGDDDLLAITGSEPSGRQLFVLRKGFRSALTDEPVIAPVLVGRLPAGTDLRWLSSDGRWALVSELTGPGVLIDLPTGREYALEGQIAEAQ